MTSAAIITTPAPEQTATVFRQSLTAVTYDCIHPLRAKLLEFMDKQGMDAAYAGMFALTVTEVLTNLVKHPPRKAGYTEVKLRLTPRHIYLDISDDSAAFADFDAKCKTALSRLNAAGSLSESGYGLGCILRQHTHVTYTPAPRSPDGLNHFRVRDSARRLIPRPAADTQHKPCVFIVDDDPVALLRHGDMLEELYDVVTFGDARQAVQAFAAERPSLVVSDLNMPGMDGIGLREALSALDGGNTTPFVFLSAQAASQNSPYISALGVDDFLCKPVSKERLLTVAARLMTRSQQVRQALEGKFHQQLTDSLKPALPERYGGWRLCTMTAAAEAGGGDFTLWHEAPAHLLAVLADVMGHGPQAKFFSYAYAGYLRSIFRLQAQSADPARFLSALSASVEGDEFLESIILTCQGFQLLPNGAAAIASAGHPPPLLVTAAGCQPLEIAGPLPGLVSDAGYNLLQLQLAAGDKLVFATDGFLQAFGLEGTRRAKLLALLDDAAHETAADTATRLWREYTRDLRSLPKDDATLVVAEYGGDA